jgi:transcriptional regulator with XRE-family HTH domain
MTKHFNNVKELIKELSTEEKFKKDALAELSNKNIAKFLFAQRCENKLSQKELAEKLNCSQSRISKIESSRDEALSVKDLLDYGRALNLQLEIGYRDKSTRIVDLIKYHAFKIKGYLEQLVKLAEDDKDMAKGILKFHVEAFANISNFVLKNIPELHQKLEKKSLKESNVVHISAPLTDKLPKEESEQLSETTC